MSPFMSLVASIWLRRAIILIARERKWHNHKIWRNPLNIAISFDQLMNDDSCFDIISFLLFQSLTKRFRQRQVFLNAWNMSIQWREWQFSDNWIIFTDKYQDNAKQGVMKKGIIEMRFINIAYSLFYDFSEVLMLKIISLLTYLFVTWS